MDLLFPHTWQLKLEPRDPDYREHNQQNLEARLKMIKLVIEFVNSTQRLIQQETGE